MIWGYLRRNVFCTFGILSPPHPPMKPKLKGSHVALWSSRQGALQVTHFSKPVLPLAYLPTYRRNENLHTSWAFFATPHSYFEHFQYIQISKIYFIFWCWNIPMAWDWKAWKWWHYKLSPCSLSTLKTALTPASCWHSELKCDIDITIFNTVVKSPQKKALAPVYIHSEIKCDQGGWDVTPSLVWHWTK